MASCYREVAKVPQHAGLCTALPAVQERPLLEPLEPLVAEAVGKEVGWPQGEGHLAQEGKGYRLEQEDKEEDTQHLGHLDPVSEVYRLSTSMHYNSTSFLFTL